MPKIIENELLDTFKDRDIFSRDELLTFYRQFEPDLKQGTLGWRIHDLKERNIINTVKRGHYSISNRPDFEPEISSDVLKLGKTIGDKFKDVKFCVWETTWLDDFLLHQSCRTMILVEIEKGYEESLYVELKKDYNQEVFLNPDEREIKRYISESKRPIVINKLVTRSPLSERLEKKKTIPTPQLEKILVDLFAEEKLFHDLQVPERIKIYENAITNYAINFTRLFSYAKRRERDLEIKEFMTIYLAPLVNDIIYD